VIAIIGVLAALLLPTTRQMLVRAQSTRCANNLHQLGVAIHAYAQDNEQKLPAVEPVPSSPGNSPPLPSLHDALLKYVDNNEEVLHCPRDKTRWPVEGSSYLWVYIFSDDLIDVPIGKKNSIPPEKAALLVDYENFHADQGGSKTKNRLFADGHVDSF